MSEHACSRTIAVIGAGFSGVMTASHLSRLGAKSGTRVVLIEREKQVGRGVAYSASSNALLLNVPAGNMSAFPDRPLDFVNWARRRDANVSEGTFLPRSWYGDYLQEILQDHVKHHGLEVVRGEVVDAYVSNGQPLVSFRDGRTRQVDRVVIAGATFAPANPPIDAARLFDSPRYIRNPWESSRLFAISPDDSVLLIGTGLTAVDVVLQLLEQGHQGVIHAVSRRGMIPQSHRPSGQQRRASIPWELLEAPRTTISMLRAFRAAVRRMQSLGFDWRDVIAAIRPITPTLWESLALSERSRFLRHLRTHWEAHRHRMAPQIARTLETLREAGTFVTHAARIIRAECFVPSTRVVLRKRGSQQQVDLDVAWIINCTGPDSDLRRVRDPLWLSLLHRGLVQRDELRLGALTSTDGAMVDEAGVPSEWLYLVGPLRKAQLWESTAVPELRVQALEVAQRLSIPGTRPSRPTGGLAGRSRSAARARRQSTSRATT